MLKHYSTRQLSVAALFLLPGLYISTWVTRTPVIRDDIGASTAQMGLVLFGLSVGSMAGILLGGALLARLGTRPLVLIGTCSVVASLPVIGLGSLLGSALLVTIGLALFGLGMGGGEVALNVEGGEIEQETRKPFLPLLHGCFSLGTTIGALLGIAFTAVAVPAAWHLGLVAAVAAVLAVVAVRGVPAGVGKSIAASTAASAGAPARTTSSVWKDPALVVIGLVILAMALAEGTANDWLPLVMVDGHGLDQALSSAVYATFALSMTIGRFAGGWFVTRYGRAAVLSASALLGAAGIAVVAYVDNPYLAGLAVVLWGLGASLGFPVALSAAADSGPGSAARVSSAAALGYTAFLVGPPVLGFAGEEVGLRSALGIPLVLLVAAAVLATRVTTRQDDAEQTDRAESTDTADGAVCTGART